MRAQVARQIQQLVGGKIGRREAMQDLLVGGVGRLGRAPIVPSRVAERAAQIILLLCSTVGQFPADGQLCSCRQQPLLPPRACAG